MEDGEDENLVFLSKQKTCSPFIPITKVVSNLCSSISGHQERQRPGLENFGVSNADLVQAPSDYTSVSLMDSERAKAESKLQAKAEEAERERVRARILEEEVGREQARARILAEEAQALRDELLARTHREEARRNEVGPFCSCCTSRCCWYFSFLSSGRVSELQNKRMARGFELSCVRERAYSVRVRTLARLFFRSNPSHVRSHWEISLRKRCAATPGRVWSIQVKPSLDPMLVIEMDVSLRL
jgi:hypothetical protein